MSVASPFLALTLLLFSSPASAFRLSPMVLEFAPSGKNATQTILLENPDKNRVALQLEVTKRKVDIDGKEDRSEVVEDFVVFPDQLTLEPGQKRNVRVTWVGEGAPKQELAFRLVASQLPVTLDRPTDRADVKVNLKFVLQYVASLYVVPSGVKAEVKVESAKLLKAGSAEVVLRNSGGMHRVLEKAKIRFLGGGKAFEVPEAVMKEVRAQNILAGGARRFQFTVPKDLKDAKAEIQFD